MSAFPFCLRAARTAVAGVDPRAEQLARTMGLHPARIAVQVVVPLASRGILVGLTLGYLRALGEYGATWVVGGAILGRTQTMSIAVVDAPSWDQAAANIKVLLVLALLALGLLAHLRREPS